MAREQRGRPRGAIPKGLRNTCAAPCACHRVRRPQISQSQPGVCPGGQPARGGHSPKGSETPTLPPVPVRGRETPGFSEPAWRPPWLAAGTPLHRQRLYRLSSRGSPQFQQRNWDSEFCTKLAHSQLPQVPFRLVARYAIQIVFSLLGPQVVPAPAEEAGDGHSAPITAVERRVRASLVPGGQSSKPDTSGLALSGPL